MEPKMDFLFLTSIRVQFRDVDSMGHVNNAVYLSYLESARMDFYEHVFGPDGFDRFPYIIAEVTVKYLRPAYLRQWLEVGIRVSHIGNKSFRYQYVVRDKQSGETIAQAESVQVMYDYKEKKSLPVPQAWRDTILAL